MASKTVTDLDRQLYLTANKCAVRLLHKQIMETLTIEWAKANSMAANWHFKWVTKWVRFQSSHSARSNSIFCATQNYLGAHLGSGFGEMVGGGGCRRATGQRPETSAMGWASSSSLHSLISGRFLSEIEGVRSMSPVRSESPRRRRCFGEEEDMGLLLLSS